MAEGAGGIDPDPAPLPATVLPLGQIQLELGTEKPGGRHLHPCPHVHTLQGVCVPWPGDVVHTTMSSSPQEIPTRIFRDLQCSSLSQCLSSELQLES